MGIEVVRGFEYEIETDAHFLDGELPVHPHGAAELVRMPVALISHRALRRFLEPGSYRPTFTEDEPPSIVGGRIKPDEINTFD